MTATRTIIAGSRDVDMLTTLKAIESCPWKDEIETVISGTARGVDTYGEMWALRNGRKVERYPANWDTEGRSAGYRRNERMAKVSDALIAVWKDGSKGTRHMIDEATRRGLKVFVVNV